MIPILILAAGASSRMRGVDKLMLDIDGVPLLRRQAIMALEVSSDVRIALPLRPHPRFDVVQDLAVRPIEVSDANTGISASLRALFATLEQGTPHAMLLLADLPDIQASDLRLLIQATQTHPDAKIWRASTPMKKAGHPMIASCDFFQNFQNLAGDNGGQSILKAAGDAMHLVPLIDDRARQDLDTPEAWAAWRAARAGSVT